MNLVDIVNAPTLAQRDKLNADNARSYQTAVAALRWGWDQGRADEFPQFVQGFPYPAGEWVAVQDTSEAALEGQLMLVQTTKPVVTPVLKWVKKDGRVVGIGW